MSNGDLSDFLRDVEILKGMFDKSKARFPYMDQSSIGHTSFVAGTYYIQRGHCIKFQYQNPITADDLKENNEITNWHNQNFLVRLCAILEAYQLIGNKIPIDKSLPGATEVDLLRRLRNRFAHGSGRFDPTNSEHAKLRQRIIEHFQLSSPLPDGFPIPINRVCDPLLERCIEYAKAKFSHTSGQENREGCLFG